MIGAVVGVVGRPVVLVRHGRRWASRRAAHLLAFAGALWSQPTALWRQRSAETRAAGHRVLAPIRFVTTPLRSGIRGGFTRLSGIERLVSGSDQVIGALADSGVGREAPVLRTVYAERLDAMQRSFVIGENRTEEARRQREEVAKILDASLGAVDRAVDGAGQLARALVTASEGRVDAVGGVIIPCCERAMARFLDVDDAEGAPLFAAGQLLLHRVFLNPASPAGVSDWYAERASRAASQAFEKVIEAPRLLTGVASAQPADESSRDAALSAAIMLATAIGPHVAWVASYVLDELLRHPAHLGRHPWGQEVDPAPPPEQPPSTDPRVRLILEAMRHHPVVPGLLRDCPHANDLTYRDTRHRADQVGPADDTSCRRPLRSGVTLVYTRTAEFDRARRGSARSILAFDPDRFTPTDGEAQGPPTMSFSHGLHECLGRDIALRLMVAILDPLLSQDQVRRDPTRRGLLLRRLRPYSPLRSSGSWPFPTNLYVRFAAGIRA